MKKLKSYFLGLFLAATITSISTSCMTTKTSVGKFREIRGNEYSYAKGKQFWLFWGMVPLGRTNVNTPGDGNCEVITKFKFGDFLISGITLGVVTSYSINVRAKRDNQANL